MRSLDATKLMNFRFVSRIFSGRWDGWRFKPAKTKHTRRNALLLVTLACVMLMVGGVANADDTSGTSSPLTSAEMATLLRALNRVSTPSRIDPVAFNTSVTTKLLDYDHSLNSCLTAAQHAPAGVDLGAILSGLGRTPAKFDFVPPDKFAALQMIIGTDNDFRPYDAELCARAINLDRAFYPSSDPNAALKRVDSSLLRCLSVVKSVGPNRRAARILEQLVQQPGSTLFTSAETLPALEASTGQSFGLSQTELETCVGAYDIAYTRPGIFVGDHPPPCVGNEAYCGGISGVVCCSAGEVCSSNCQGSACNAGCEAQWCFPGDATVRDQAAGPKPIGAVRVGDRLQVVEADGSLGYEDVYLITHDDATAYAPYLSVTLASGQVLTLSERHFVPTASNALANWRDRLVKGANELRPGDLVWAEDARGALAPSRVDAVARKPGRGAFSPLTMSGTLVVDGVVASAHSDWFLDGYVSADAQATIYQAMFAPARAIYGVIGPAWTREITERWGVVDFVRDHTATAPLMAGQAAFLILIAGIGVAVLRRRGRQSA